MDIQIIIMMNNNSDDIVKIMFVVGVFMGVFFTILKANTIPGTITNIGRIALNECQETLPRNQHCIITAIPSEEK